MNQPLSKASVAAANRSTKTPQATVAVVREADAASPRRIRRRSRCAHAHAARAAPS